MPISALHRVEYFGNESCRYPFVKEIAHGIDKNHARFSPRQRLLKPLRSKRQVETIFEGVARSVPEALGEAFSITMVAAGTDLGATRYRIPRRIRPLDGCHIRHC